MKIFISSLITGMEPFRAAAKEAVTQLGDEAVMAEDFGAKAHSPQVACLDGLRKSGLVILILGAGYGDKQSTGLSATHEEYREAKGSHPVIAFVQENVDRTAEQEAFIKEVQGWERGLFRGGFNTAEKLKASITRAIHEWQLSTVVAPLDTDALRQAAIDAVIEEQEGRSGRLSLILSFAVGPVQPILRPTEIEKASLADDLLQGALFGHNKIFSTEKGNKRGIEGDSLVLLQEEKARMIKLDPKGNITLRLKIEEGNRGLVVIKEQLEQNIIAAIKYAGWLLDTIDPTQRITHVAIGVAFSNDNNVLIRTQAEDLASPNSYSMGFFQGDRRNQPVCLSPAHRPRAALKFEAEHLAEDLVTLLKRGTGNRHE